MEQNGNQNADDMRAAADRVAESITEGIQESRDYFGPLYPYVLNEDITDIDFNGRELWLTDSKNTRFLCEDLELPDDFVEQFTKRVANTVSQPFHKQQPVLEAETDTLRITIVHESVAISGRSFCIRKSLPKIRLSEETMIESGYCSRAIHEFLKSCIKARFCITFCGEPGSGKTECAKYFSQYIPNADKVIVIEDTPELHYSKINPAHDSLELKVGGTMDYTTAIKTCMRLNPKWMFLSEVRSKEVLYLIEGFSTGVKGITTLHTDDVRKVPDRMLNMAGQKRSETRLENDIYAFLDVAVMIRRKEIRGKNGKTEIRRFIDQIGLFYREDKENRFFMLAEDGDLRKDELPDDFKKRFLEAGIENPFRSEAETRMRGEQKIRLFEEERMQRQREDCVRQMMREMNEMRRETGAEEGGTYRGARKIVG